MVTKRKREKVKWPGKAYDQEADDLGVPLQQLLVDLHVLEEDGEEPTVLATPASVQVITAGAFALSKGWSAAVAALGGGGAILTASQGFGYGSKTPLLAATFTGAAGLIAASTVIAIAIIVRADLLARATASAAQYQARASISSALLGSAQYNVPPPPEPQPQYMVRTNDNRWHAVESFSLGDGGIVFAHVRGGGTPTPSSDITAIIPTSSWNAS